MKHLVRGTAGLSLALALGACYDYPTAAINNDNFHIVAANPVVGYIAKPGDSLQVFLRLTNDFDNAAITSWTITNPNPNGIEVHYDALYRPIYVDDSTTAPETDKNQQRYFVLAKAPGIYTFTATPTSVNTGVSGTITIRVQPGDLGATALKQTVRTTGQLDTIVAPQYIKFSPTTTLTISTFGGVNRTVATTALTVSADSNMIIFNVATGDNGVVTVNNAIFDIPGLSGDNRIATIKTGNALDLVKPTDLGPAIAQTSRTNLQIDSLIMPNGIKATQQSVMTINKAAGGTRTLTFVTGVTPAAGFFGLSALGNVIFNVATGDTGPISMTNMIMDLPGVNTALRFTFATTNSLVTVP